jgi:hypothetical protein
MLIAINQAKIYQAIRNIFPPQNALDFPLSKMLTKGLRLSKRFQFSWLRLLWLLSPGRRTGEDAIKSDAFSLGHSQAKRKLLEFVNY